MSGPSPARPSYASCDIRETPLDVAEVLAALGDPAAGGLALFVGTVRDHDAGGPRRSPGWSTPRTRPRCSGWPRCATRVADEYDVRGVAAVHRVGGLAIGDAAVVVATTAAHRGDAFEASRALIDELKATVPIWKHQRFARRHRRVGRHALRR